MESNERWFWVAMVVTFLVLKVVVGSGLAHMALPTVFDPPTPSKACAAHVQSGQLPDDGTCRRWRELIDKKNPPPAPASPARAAMKAVAVGEGANV